MTKRGLNREFDPVLDFEQKFGLLDYGCVCPAVNEQSLRPFLVALSDGVRCRVGVNGLSCHSEYFADRLRGFRSLADQL